jgi:hypothetical protein
MCLLCGAYLTATAAAADQIPISNATATQFSGQFPPASAHDGLTNESEPGPGPHTDTYWLSEDGLLSDTITFDLDTTDAPGGYIVTQVDIVNTSNSGWNDRETDEFGLEVFDSNASEWLQVVPNGTPIGVYWPDTKTVPVSGVSNITRLRLNVTNDPAIGPVTGDDVGTGLNEVTIFGEVVPEPSTLLLFSAGGILLFGLRRKRVQ